MSFRNFLKNNKKQFYANVSETPPVHIIYVLEFSIVSHSSINIHILLAQTSSIPQTQQRHQLRNLRVSRKNRIWR